MKPREPVIKSPVLSLIRKSVKQGVTLIFFLIRSVGTFREGTTQGDTFSVRPIERGLKALSLGTDQ